MITLSKQFMFNRSVKETIMNLLGHRWKNLRTEKQWLFENFVSFKIGLPNYNANLGFPDRQQIGSFPASTIFKL